MNVAVCTVAAAVAFFCGAGSESLAAPKKLSTTNAAQNRVDSARQTLIQQQGAAPKVTAKTTVNAAAALNAAPPGFQDYSVPNYANSPVLAKFVDPLPDLCSAGDNPGACIPVAQPLTAAQKSAKGIPNDGDAYEIGLRDYEQRMHSGLANPTRLRGYYDKNGTHPNTYLGPVIVAERNKPVRITFTNELPPDGKSLIAIDTTVMGAGPFEIGDLASGQTTVGNFSENRAGIHLHGGLTPWISDGTPHQWVSPKDEVGDYTRGVSTQDVPDMQPAGPGQQTLFYPNDQSSRLMFYHDHAYGITRTNVYAGEAAGYVLLDASEKAMIGAGVLPGVGTPLVIQDKSFVNGDTARGTLATDPLWGTIAPNSRPGDLWFPHVYVPNQDPYNWFPSTNDGAGMNMMGRWDYGPWIWPPVTVQVPDTIPHPSIVPEAFMDTMVVNGRVYPYMDVQRKAYRFRVLNASNDRFLNLQLYFAYDQVANKVCDGTQSNKAACTEVKMVPADATVYTLPSGPFQVEGDTREGGVPDPRTSGPKIVQIGSEGGFMPAVYEINNPAQPVAFDRDPKSMTVGNVKKGTILLGPAERADIVVDFSQVRAGAQFILYNDAPAAFPAGDKRYDYYTGGPDLTAMGGAPSTPVGVGPNTRTIMQFRVASKGAAAAPFNFATLATEVSKAYAAQQDVPNVPQAAYAPALGAAAGSSNNYATLFNTTAYTYTKPDGTTETLPIFQKAIAEEFDAYGRMSAVLGTEAMVTGNQGQNTFGFFYVDPSTENLPAGVTQIWKLTHNGVDTHAIHFHLLNVQVLNRVDWAGVIKAPDPNELGWKETVRMNPLEDIILAVRAKTPAVPATWAALRPQYPGGVPDSVRPRDPTMPLGSTMNFTQPWPYVHTDPTLPPQEFNIETQTMANTINEIVNYGWEYVWHCHLLGHEENDMMRPLTLVGAAAVVADTVAPTITTTVSPAPNTAGWNNGASVTVSIAAMDNPGGSGVATVTLNGVTSAVGTATATTSITAEAVTPVPYSAIDNAGNTRTGSVTVQIDRTAPTWAVVPTATLGAQSSVTIAGQVAPAAASTAPLAMMGSYTMTGPSPSSGTFTLQANGSFSISRSKLKAGNYTVTLAVQDVAGNKLTQSLNFTR